MPSGTMLAHGDVATRLPAQDLERARAFYAEMLGLEPVEEREGGLLYRCGSGHFALFQSAGALSGTHTQMGWRSPTSRRRSLRCARVAWCSRSTTCPGLRTVAGIATIAGNYPSKGVGERGAWFRDSEGNLLASASPSADGEAPGVLERAGAHSL